MPRVVAWRPCGTAAKWSQVVGHEMLSKRTETRSNAAQPHNDPTVPRAAFYVWRFEKAEAYEQTALALVMPKAIIPQKPTKAMAREAGSGTDET